MSELLLLTISMVGEIIEDSLQVAEKQCLSLLFPFLISPTLRFTDILSLFFIFIFFCGREKISSIGAMLLEKKKHFPPYLYGCFLSISGYPKGCWYLSSNEGPPSLHLCFKVHGNKVG